MYFDSKIFGRAYEKLVRLSWYIYYKRCFKKMGKNSFIYKQLKISRRNIECGNNVMIWKNGRIEGILKHNNNTFDPRIIFCDNVSIQQNLHLTCAKQIIIGKHTAIAANVTITDIHHPYDEISIPIELQNIRVNPVTIGEECKIFNNVVILPGTKIGKHCTIGANSVVCGDYPDYSVIVGAPARVVKRYCFVRNEWRKTDSNGVIL